MRHEATALEGTGLRQRRLEAESTERADSGSREHRGRGSEGDEHHTRSAPPPRSQAPLRTRSDVEHGARSGVRTPPRRRIPSDPRKREGRHEAIALEGTRSTATAPRSRVHRKGRQRLKDASRARVERTHQSGSETSASCAETADGDETRTCVWCATERRERTATPSGRGGTNARTTSRGGDR